MSDTADFKKRFDALQLQAEHDLAKALLDRDEQPVTARKRRTTLSSIEDSEEDSEEDSKVTAALVEGAVKGALSATANIRHEPGEVELATPGGYKFRGPLAGFVALILAAALWWLLRH